jgi:uncharacterized repeat protein (TIGR01451 family)
MKRAGLFIIPFLLAFLGVFLIFRTTSRAETTPPVDIPAITNAKIHPALIHWLKSPNSQEFIPVIIEWKSQPIETIFKSYDLAHADRAQRKSLVVEALKAHSLRQSAALEKFLRQAVYQGQASELHMFWASPAAAVKIKPSLLQSLSERSDVVQVRPDEPIYLEDASFELSTDGMAGESYLWNLDMIEVDLAEQIIGLDGSGVVVANMDTGVDWQHPALLKKYRGYNPNGPAMHTGNWFVATYEGYTYPGDGHGHGTHTMGTILGDDGEGNRTGVAPGAKWIAVKLFTNQGVTYESWIHAGFQWLLAPAGDPALAPDIVNNSWGSPIGTDTRYLPDVQALLAAGILPVFSAGNYGPESRTVGSPGSYIDSFSVGAVDEDGLVAGFSSRGPSPWDKIKPEITAPGVEILSSFPGGAYALSNGTSMSTPHVTGLAALLLQADPSLTPQEIEVILMETAQPLGDIVPNNDAGWGLVNAYAAALRTILHGTVSGKVLDENGSALSYPILSVVDLADPTHHFSITGDADGQYRIALQTGNYDINGTAFGYTTQTHHNVHIISETTINLSFVVSRLPSGKVTGQVIELDTHQPLSATLSVEGTYISTQSDPVTGIYTLTLPEGSWPISTLADGRRIGHITPTIVVSSVLTVDVFLAPAPRILLVDAGRWYYASQIGYYENALNSIDYPYTLWSIRSLGGLSYEDERPKINDLLPYDLVIWSDPQASPGWIGVGDAIYQYLENGGHLIISGQDVLFMDSAGFYIVPEDYMIELMGIAFRSEGLLEQLEGVAGGPLEGLSVPLNPIESAQQQTNPDNAIFTNMLLAKASLIWPGDLPGGIMSGVCQPYRAAWYGFGLEGTGPLSLRSEILSKTIDWMEEPPPLYGLVVKAATIPLVGLPSSVVSQTITLTSMGILSDTYDIDIEGGPWKIEIELPDGSLIQDDAAFSFAGCDEVKLTVSISIPPNQPRDERSEFTIRFTSQNDPLIDHIVTVIAKTPSAILIVDRQRAVHDIDSYKSSLDNLDISYDVLNMYNATRILPPSLDILKRYEILVWTAGYNWLDPIGLGGENVLSSFLDDGGSLLISSQDLLDATGVTDFIRSRLGVAAATLSITTTQVHPSKDNPLLLAPDVWDLTYDFTNWSDGLYPTPQGQVAVQDANLYNTAVLLPGENWRTAFYAFPIEAMDDPSRRQILGQSLLWLGPFAGSRLYLPPAALLGTEIPISITLNTILTEPVLANANIPLPTSTSIISDSIQGGWTYIKETHSLNWSGTLTPTQPRNMSATLWISDSLASGSVLPFLAHLETADKIPAALDESVSISAPWLTLKGSVSPLESAPGEVVTYTLNLSNEGVITTTAWLSATIPAGITLLPETIYCPSGIYTMTVDSFYWTGELTPDEQINIRYEGMITNTETGIRWVSHILFTDDYRSLQDWLSLMIPIKIIFPLIFR